MPLDDEIKKEAIKEALSEWLDGKFAQFGKWTAGGLLAMAIAGVLWLSLSSHGFKP